MEYSFDVVIIGAGPAGVAAAGTLAGSGLSIALLDGAVYAGAENWSGCVYFTESLAAPDCFGSAAVNGAPFERRVLRRGTLLQNGIDLVGAELTDPRVFQNCFTVLRPVFDPYFVHLARSRGVLHLPSTTVTALIRKEGRVSGVETSRGRLSAGVVFIAEGDASHLVRSEKLERVAAPHFLQGVKAVLSLDGQEIERRFGLGPGEGTAYELLIGNPSINGRTALLNAGGFLYTNRDSLSLGCVAPLDNLRNNFQGSHEHFYEWMSRLPFLEEMTRGASLSAYGAKIIRSGGWNERPILIEDGLAVGGSSAGLGIDLPFPNFTGPASATGLYFGRAVKNILRRGAVCDKRNLEQEYLEPLEASVYGRSAAYLSGWPGYFSGSKFLFTSGIDITCGLARFLSKPDFLETGRFLRRYLLSPKIVREWTLDLIKSAKALRLGKPLILSGLNPATWARWFVNLFAPGSNDAGGFKIIVFIDQKNVDAARFPWPVGSLVRRLSPALGAGFKAAYANNAVPVGRKLQLALRSMLRGFRLTDFILLPAYGGFLVGAAAAAALWDAFRFSILKTPAKVMLSLPSMVYAENRKKRRNLDQGAAGRSLEAKLATNTYRIGAFSHIRTLWPERIAAHGEMAQAGLWSICPARVYRYDAPEFSGRGSIAVNYENCVKCESCWRAEPERVIWGRHTDHRLVYRPLGISRSLLTRTIRTVAVQQGPRPALADPRLWNLDQRTEQLLCETLNAGAALIESISKLPASADKSRLQWPLALADRFTARLRNLEAALVAGSRKVQADIVGAERKAVDARLHEGSFFSMHYRVKSLTGRIKSWLGDPEAQEPSKKERSGSAYQQTSERFPDRVVKQWEDNPVPKEWAEKLRLFIREHRGTPFDVVRALSSVSPALGLVAAGHLRALAQYRGQESGDLCAVRGDRLSAEEQPGGLRLAGRLTLVPIAASSGLLIMLGPRACLVPFATAGMRVTPTPAIGFRAAGLADVSLDCMVPSTGIIETSPEEGVSEKFYLAVALGALEYLSRRARDHALSRIQFSGQMIDTEGRDGVAKLGAVKALLARIEAWKLLLERLGVAEDCAGDGCPHPAIPIPLAILRAVLPAMAFSPEPGAVGYDAGQVFGGFAFSEDDLLSRFYRDSALFRFLEPGYGAAAQLDRAVSSDRIEQTAMSCGLSAINGEPLSGAAERLRMQARACASIPGSADRALAGEAKALVLGAAFVLAEIESGIDRGASLEAETAASEVLISLVEGAVARAKMSVQEQPVSPLALFPIEPWSRVECSDVDYEIFCKAGGEPHQSGGFLSASPDNGPRFVPEMQLLDSGLRERWLELTTWFKANCRDRRFDGLQTERWIDKRHRLPDEVIDAVKKKKWLATSVPQALDGLGWRKAEYYILNSAAGTFGDASIDLLIMASTSIGTTPVLLGLQEELRRVREELEPLTADPARIGEIGNRLKVLAETFVHPDPSWIRKEFAAIMNLVDDRIRATRVVKYLASHFLRAFYQAGMAGKRGDFTGFTGGLNKAIDLFEALMPDVRAALAELPRRERCHELFLRGLAHGGVSAFALTEPTAGSDSGGVKTTAVLMRAGLRKLDDGRYSFESFPGKPESRRCLIDADLIAFVDGAMAYQTPDGNRAAIRYDRYDYTTDRGVRYYRYDGRDCEFHDIGQVRVTPSGPIYEYYQVNGSKMWITNGRIATQFCLYARTAEGVTGFMVDRHAEGLTVGADERKMGQRGSPTNEISIDNARVPREAVIGYEGHGQVNALETLNVGRCGLAVVSGALMRKLLHEALVEIAPEGERDRLLGEAAAILFGSESLAYYLVGLFDRPHRSVRMESAIAKFLCSEDLHEFLGLLERAYGPIGLTEKHLLEKARRDSRILTIYEGTNEVQRFLILKDLIAMASVPPGMQQGPGDADPGVFSKWRNRLGEHLRQAAAALGDSAWSDAMLQPALFPLAEMAGELLRLSCILHRIAWIEAHAPQLAESDPDYPELMIRVGRRAALRAQARLEDSDRRYSFAGSRVALNLQMPEVIAADAALAREAAPAHAAASSSRLSAGLRILVIIRPMADLSPALALIEGTLEEIVWRADSSDLAALYQATALKERGSRVTVDVLMPGGAEHEDILRACPGVDRLYRLAANPAAPADRWIVRAVRDLEVFASYGLIMIGAASAAGERLAGAYLAGSLGRLHYLRDAIGVKQDGSGLAWISCPAVVSTTSSAEEIPGDINETIEGHGKEIKTLVPLEDDEIVPVRFGVPRSHAAPDRPLVSTVSQAVDYLIAFSKQEGTGSARAYAGEVRPGQLLNGWAVWALLDAQDQRANRAVLRGSSCLAGMLKVPARVLIPAPRSLWPRLVEASRGAGCAAAFCVDTAEGRLSNDGRRNLARLLMTTTENPLLTGGDDWTSTFACLAGERAATDASFHTCFHAIGMEWMENGKISLSVPAYGGRIVRKEELSPDRLFLTLGPEAEFSEAAPVGDFEAMALEGTLTQDELMPLSPLSAPSLAQADVIIDLGYGIRDRAGYELAVNLKKTLEKIGLSPLFGATRKVTQDLKLLPLANQIGQTGVRVNPKLLIALGVSGAPQHVDYIGSRTEIICFNKDPEAALMKQGRPVPAPRVHPVPGDLFVTVAELIEGLEKQNRSDHAH